MNALDRKLVEMGLLEAAPEWFEVLLPHFRAFVAEHGHCLVPTKYACPDGYKLGVRANRIRAEDTKLTDDQRDKLNALGFVWVVRGTWWPEFIQHLRTFHDEHGHCKVPVKYGCSDGYNLGKKVSDIRAGNNQPTEDQLTDLESINFIWDASYLGAWWIKVFIAHLKAFKAEHGHYNVTTNHVGSDGYPLGLHVRRVRKEYSKAPADLRVKLEALGFLWDYYGWYPRLITHLRVFKAEYGHCDVPLRYICSDGYKLGRALASMRVRRLTQVTQSQKSELDALGVLWDVAHLRLIKGRLKVSPSPVVTP